MSPKARFEVAVLGCGAMSARLAVLLRHANLRLWGRKRPEILPAPLQAMVWQDSIAAACEGADTVLLSVPIGALREVAREYGTVARGNQVVYFVERGVELGFVLPHQVLREETCVRQLAVLGGPLQSFAPRRSRPAAIVVGSAYPEPVARLRALSAGVPALIYSSPDMLGVE
jgi:glycerol-3-phosphate dehydrogenase